ncbi:MAG: CARDB domain-containing protein [Candidatus Thermoplasmatota archaeon]|nr:CARDB domain-containing protein [Candidatus Thermoplasmatota archaeon]
MSSASHTIPEHKRSAIGIVVLMLMVSLSHIQSSELEEITVILPTPNTTWNDLEQPWGQYGGSATRNGTMPQHDSEIGPILSIDDPIINWVALEDDVGSDAYGSIIGNFSESVTVSPGAVERCSPSGLFAVILHESTSTSSTKLSLIAGDDAQVAWQVDLGVTRAARSTPVLVDADLDGKIEVVVVYDTDNSLQVDVWSPELSCDESGWQSSGHSNELMWSWTNTDYRIGITSPHFQTRQSNHLSVTQPLLADLELDGQPELVLTVVDTTTDDPHILSLPLGSSTPTVNWDVTLDRGTHPSDPSWAQLDGQNSVVLATTIDENSGNMWVWRIDGNTGSNDWGRVPLSGTDTDSDAPRLRLPSPIVVQLDSDAAPEMILTIPTDGNGRTVGLGARFVGMELTSTQEIFSFRSRNGYADAPPLPMDLDNDGIHDRLCWVTWYSASSVTFDREGMVGCHDLTNDPPTEEWAKIMNRGGSGNDNDEIAVSPPAWMNIDGEGDPEIVVAFGRRIFVFEGDTGYDNEVSEGWDEPLSMPHRVWSAPAFADLDGDGYLDMLYGDTLVSQRMLDLAPLPDGNGISFNPVSPDPGQTLTITGQFANIGTWENEDNIDCALYMNGQELTRVRFEQLDPLSPSGEGGPATFSFDVTATLGTHTFELVLDVNDNLTESREDNNAEVATLTVVEPYAVLIQGPEVVTRIEPGTTENIEITITATGSRTANWDIVYDASNLPESWSVEPEPGTNLLGIELVPEVPLTLPFVATLPSDALGDEDGYVEIVATLNSDSNIEHRALIPIEALRTRGLSLVGPSGLAFSEGFGIAGHTAETYVLIENLGNAVETTTSIDWTSPSWGGTPVLFDGVSSVYSITLQPGEKKELRILLDVPSSVSEGSVTSTTLTTCIGSGEETLCRSLDANFTAALSHTSPTHIRTVPATTHQFEFRMILPQTGILSWDLNQANMLLPNWQWNVTSGGTLQNGILEANGPSNSYHIVELEVYIPPNAAPQRLIFETDEQSSTPHLEFKLSVHVLQIHRAALQVIDPVASSDPHGFNVSTSYQIMIQLENPGNGQDTYEFVARVLPNEFVSSEDVTFTYFNPTRTLGPLGTTFMPLGIELDEDLPAASPFYLEFEWASIINKSVSATTPFLIQAEQRHEWEILIVGGDFQEVQPNTDYELKFNITNIGNYQDEVQLIPTLTVTTEDNDTSVWQAHQTMNSSILEVNQSSTLTVVQQIPYAWKNANAKLSYQVISSGYILDQFDIDLNVLEYSQWDLNLANSNLEIMPGGDYIEVVLEQKGNTPSVPFLTKFGQGWNVSMPNGSLMEPGQSQTVEIYVEAPSDAREGDVNILQIRVSDAIGQGMEVFQVPVRVIGSSNYDVQSTDSWYVSSNGGFPLAWIENTGNDLPEFEFQVMNLPQGWTAVIDSPTQVVPGALKGLPINLNPPENWDKESFDITVQITHPTLGIELLDFTVESSNFSFSSSPVLWGRGGTQLSVDIHKDSNQQLEGEMISVTDSTYTFQIPTETKYVNLSSTDESIQLVLIGRETPSLTASCSFRDQAFANLGVQQLTGDIVTCNVLGDNDESTKMSFLVSTNRGDEIPINRSVFTILQNESTFANLSVANWDPSPGSFTLIVSAYDQYGNMISQIENELTSRESDWNIGISSISAQGSINVALSRTNYQVLEDAVCFLTVTSKESDFKAEVLVKFTGSDFSPNVRIDSDGLADQEQLDAQLQCNSPFDIDDDESDNSATIVFVLEEPTVLSTSNVVISLLVTTSLVIIYLVLIQREDNLLNQASKRAENTNKSKPKNRSNESVSAKDQDVDEDDSTLIQQINDQEEDSIPTMIEEIPLTDDSTASGRLDSLRREMEPENDEVQQSSIEERMSKFFQ